MHYCWGLILFLFSFDAVAGSVTLAWDASTSSGVTAYIVRYGTSPGRYTAQENAGLATSKTISGLPDGFRYYFVVTAIGAGGESDYSNEVNWMHPFNNPPVQIILDISKAELTLPMITVQDASFYGNYILSTNNNSGLANWSFVVPFPDEYVIWASVLCPNDSVDSFFVSVNNGPLDIYDAAKTWTNIWQWTMVNGRGGADKPFESAFAIDPRTFIISGVSSIQVNGREQGTALNRLLITNDRNLVPKVPPAPDGLQLTVER